MHFSIECSYKIWNSYYVLIEYTGMKDRTRPSLETDGALDFLTVLQLRSKLYFFDDIWALYFFLFRFFMLYEKLSIFNFSEAL